MDDLDAWIHVDDELPELGQFVLAIAPMRYYNGDLGIYMAVYEVRDLFEAEPQFYEVSAPSLIEALFKHKEVIYWRFL